MMDYLCTLEQWVSDLNQFKPVWMYTYCIGHHCWWHANHRPSVVGASPVVECPSSRGLFLREKASNTGALYHWTCTNYRRPVMQTLIYGTIWLSCLYSFCIFWKPFWRLLNLLFLHCHCGQSDSNIPRWKQQIKHMLMLNRFWAEVSKVRAGAWDEEDAGK